MQGARYYVDRYFLLWMLPLLRKGASNKLTEDDIPELEDTQRNEYLKQQWRKEWTDAFEEFDSRRRHGKTSPNEKPSIILPVFRIFKTRLIFSISMRVAEDFAHFAKPLFLSLLIEYLSSDDASFLYGGMIIAGCYLMAQLRSSLYNVFTREQNEMATLVHGMLNSAVYEKSLLLSPSVRASTTDGDVMNLVMGDVESMFDAFRLMHNFISAPLQFLFAFGLLWRTLGPATVAALTVTAVMIPLNHWVWMQSKGLIGERGRVRGERIKTCTEMLSGMKVIKLYAWEAAFEEKIEKLRKEEVDLNRRGNLILRASDLINVAAPFVMALLCFSIYLFTDAHGVLTPQIALFSLTIFHQIQFPVELCRSLIYVCSFCGGAHDRLRAFFALEESDEIASRIAESDVVVELEDASFGWKEEEAALKDINLTLKSGEITAVMGSVGSGKSSLLSAIAGSMQLQSGTFNRRGSVALVSQQTWLMNTTVRENILFGKEFEAALYQKIVQACELEHDFAVLADGDQTVVGENGSLLSGGQKARVSLARAVYQDADIYLLDDPLSAVDVHIGESIYKNVIGQGGLLKDKARLLITHNVKYTEGSKVLIMKDGTLTSDTKDLEKLAEISQEDEVIEESTEDSEKTENNGPELRKRKQSERLPSEDEAIHEEEDKKKPQENIWLYLIKAAGYSNTLMFILTQTLHFAFKSARSIYVASWSNDESAMGSRIWSFALFGAAEVISFIVSCHFLQAACAECALNIHRPLLRDVLTLPMRFFDTHPIGDALSRFGSDLDTVDLSLPMAVRSFLKAILENASIFFVISYASPLFIMVLIPLIIVYVMIMNLHIATSKQLRAMEQNTRSPYYSFTKECCNGRETIRAFGKENHTSALLGSRLDRFARAKMTVQWSTRFLCHNIDIMANLIILFAALFASISCRYFGVAPAMAGLALSYAFNLDLPLFTHTLSYIEHYKAGAERVRDYAGLAKEQISMDNAATKDWIEDPTIEIGNLTVRYADDLPLVLKNLSISIAAREKVAVVGRTGSGKSSLTMALFRMVQPCSGSIRIDGKRIDSVELKDLRAGLAIIPQDPVLFSGSLRSNLDPFGACSDEELWRALDQCQMKETIDNLGGLDCEIDESGKNLSVGQRQLLCLARVLIRRVKILILDEATSSIDNRSADLIRTVVRDRFKDATVISIAHRLESIEGYDRVLVMHDGEVAEFDSPGNLLNNPESKYAQMMKK